MIKEPKIPKHLLPVIIFSQFAGTSLWFAGNAITEDLKNAYGLEHLSTGTITSSVQLGFIAGTLVFAFFAISDKYSSRELFFASSLLGAASNLLLLSGPLASSFILPIRFLTGFFLAGIYPIGMKIAAGWYNHKLGNALGMLVGALVLGTAFPHLLKSFGDALNWKSILLGISILALSGGLFMFLLVPEGPYSKSGTKFDWRSIPRIFQIKTFRAAALGYFGHMWELYTFWAFVPFMLVQYHAGPSSVPNLSLWAFIVIAAGSIGCVAGGWISIKAGNVRVAFFQLLLSGLCCFLSPLILGAPPLIFFSFLIIWGVMVVGDSPQFSAINALTAPSELVGTGLTIVNSIGFGITIVSLQFTQFLSEKLPPQWVLLSLAAGPVLGLLAMKPLLSELMTDKEPKKQLRNEHLKLEQQ